MTVPVMLNNKEFLEAPLNYKWDNETSDFYCAMAESDKIDTAFVPLNHKALMGMLTAVCEWIYWRVANHPDLDIPLAPKAIEGDWASIIDKHYSIMWVYGSRGYTSDPVNGPVWTMLKLMNYPRQNYYKGKEAFIHLDRLVLLARHISPNPKQFEQWFQNTIKKAAQTFPIKAEPAYDGTIEYDSTYEAAIPREFFFDENYDFATADNAFFINQFLSSLNYDDSPFLNSPEKMVELGFKGTPYKY